MVSYYPIHTTPAGVEFMQILRHSYKHMTSLRSSSVKLFLIYDFPMPEMILDSPGE
jgi:hypothetical protein